MGEGSACEASTPLKMCKIYERKLGSGNCKEENIQLIWSFDWVEISAERCLSAMEVIFVVSC